MVQFSIVLVSSLSQLTIHTVVLEKWGLDHVPCLCLSSMPCLNSPHHHIFLAQMTQFSLFYNWCNVNLVFRESSKHTAISFFLSFTIVIKISRTGIVCWRSQEQENLTSLHSLFPATFLFSTFYYYYSTHSRKNKKLYRYSTRINSRSRKKLHFILSSSQGTLTLSLSLSLFTQAIDNIPIYPFIYFFPFPKLSENLRKKYLLL